MDERRIPFGTLPNGEQAELLRISSDKLDVTICTMGAIVVNLMVPDRDGNKADIVWGFDSLQPYLDVSPYYGANVGRFGGRIANSTFSIDGTEYHLASTGGPHCLHGGPEGFHLKNFSVAELTESSADLVLVSPDGDQGFPGTLTLHVIYTLEGGILHIRYHAVSDKDTVINITNHSYFNLAGHDAGTLEGQYLQIPAVAYLETDADTIPTGRLLCVAGSEVDFREKRDLGPVRADHTLVLEGGDGLHPVARVEHPASGRVFEELSDQPAVQLYTSINMPEEGITGKGGAFYERMGAFCLEAQAFPDAPNHPYFPSAVLRAGDVYERRTCWKFSILD